MHPSVLHVIIMVAAGAAVAHGLPAAHTPAALFWEKTLPGTRMPDAIADLVQNGIHRSPLAEHYTASPSADNVCIIYSFICDLGSISTGLLFHEAQLRAGTTMTASFSAEASSAILPHDVAEKVPFTNLQDVLATFSIPAGSEEASQVRDTIRRCEAPPLSGEVQTCTSSLESTVRRAVDMLGAGDVWAATSDVPLAGLPRRPYEVEAVTPMDGDHPVVCHKMPFPYVVYECHMAATSSKVYKVSLRVHGGAASSVLLAICHQDTSSWNPAHPIFQALNTHPGGEPVCHFVPYANLVFGKKKATAKALIST